MEYGMAGRKNQNGGRVNLFMYSFNLIVVLVW